MTPFDLFPPDSHLPSRLSGEMGGATLLDFRHDTAYIETSPSNSFRIATRERMSHSSEPGVDVYEFILENIDTVPHLEALVLLWNSRPVWWTCEELTSRLYVPVEKVAQLLRDLVRMDLIAESPTSPPKYSYLPKSEQQNELLLSLDTAYRRDLVRISTIIHSKTSSGVREFARAFKLRQEKK